MTAKLRNFIKERDHFTCKQCSASVAAEPNLLLEVDHIVPVSKGGLSELTNLQTLCWRCNRTKSNKLLTA
jgi:5-methylcytosine-specific restriction endonuclease McrA